MQVSVTSLLKEIGRTESLHEVIQVDFPKEELDVAGDVKLDLTLTNAGELILVEGKIGAEIRLPCSRCGKVFQTPLVAEVEEEYSCHLPVVTDETEKELTEQDFIFTVSEENMIDLLELIRQNLILAIPTQVFCSPDCRLPERPPEPSQKTGDPRLDVLRNLIPPG